MKKIFIFVLLFLFLYIDMNKKIKEIKMENIEIKKKLKEHDELEHFTINGDMDQQATNNLMSLIKGEPMTLSSLHITGTLIVDGETNMNSNVSMNKGTLTVNGETNMNNNVRINNGILYVIGKGTHVEIYNNDTVGGPMIRGSNGTLSIPWCSLKLGGDFHAQNRAYLDGAGGFRVKGGMWSLSKDNF